MSIYSEIKKYLLYLVGTFCVLICAHIVILYFYHDAVTYALPGGTVNVGIVNNGDIPSLDASQYETKIEGNTNDTLLRFLYRGMIRFSLRDKKIVGDIGSCGLDTFPVVRCSINADAVWNDGSPITVEDITSTFAFFRDNAQSEITKNRLALVTVAEDKSDIVFTFKTRDATVVDILFLPILRKKDIETPFSLDTLAQNSFSGPYIFYSHDPKKDIYLFRRNPYYGHEGLVQFFDQVRFGFGADDESVLDLIDADVVIGKHDVLDDAFIRKNYIRPVYYGIFLNSSSLPKALRNGLVNDAFSALKDTTNAAILPEQNIFLGDVPSTPLVPNTNLFVQATASLGYSYGGVAAAQTNTAPVLVKPLQYITKPGAQTPLFMGDPSVEISGKTPANTDRVVINDYTLKNFTANSGQFTYKAEKALKNLVDGQNLYTVTFYRGNQQLAQEKVLIYYQADANELAKIKENWKTNATATAAQTQPVVVNTSLDPKKLYSRDKKMLMFKIIVQADVPYFQDVANTLTTRLRDLGAEVETQTMNVADIRKNLQNPNFAYDMVISGINLGLFHYNIAPYFHSGQIKEGVNLSHARDPRLDTLIEKLTERLYYSSPEKLRALQESIQKYLEQEALLYTLGSPLESISIKESVLGKNIPEYIPGTEMLVDILSRTYFKQGYRLSETPKNPIDFIEWLKNALFPTS